MAMNPTQLKKLAKNRSPDELEKMMKNHIGKDDTLLPFNSLTSKKVDYAFRRAYLLRIRELFTIIELAEKWNSDVTTVLRFLGNNGIPCFDGDNAFERTINLLFNHGISKKEISQRLTFMNTCYTIKSICEYFNIHQEQLEFYYKVFDNKLDNEFNNTNKKDMISEKFTLIYQHDKIDNYEIISALRVSQEKEVDSKTMIDMVTHVDANMNVIKTEFRPVQSTSGNNKTPITSNVIPIHRKKYSIIRFLNLNFSDRKMILNRLNDEKKTAAEVEEQLGIPSAVYYRKIKVRHLIFDFHNKDKMKNKLKTFTSFEDVQKFLINLWESESYEEYDFKKDKFKMFLDDYFDIKITKGKSKDAVETISVMDFDKFKFAITKQAVYCYEKNSRITNLVQEEVDNFKNSNRSTISDKELIGIIKDVIKDSYEDKQRWVSLFDLKTAIEKKNYNIENIQRIEDTVDDLIDKKFFVNEFKFIVKKEMMDNPVLARESYVRYEFIELPIMNDSSSIPPIAMIGGRHVPVINAFKFTPSMIENNQPIPMVKLKDSHFKVISENEIIVKVPYSSKAEAANIRSLVGKSHFVTKINEDGSIEVPETLGGIKINWNNKIKNNRCLEIGIHLESETNETKDVKGDDKPVINESNEESVVTPIQGESINNEQNVTEELKEDSELIVQPNDNFMISSSHTINFNTDNIDTILEVLKNNMQLYNKGILTVRIDKTC